MKKNFQDFIRKCHIDFLRFKGNKTKTLPLYKSSVIIAPHPDDEVIGCGGLISRLVADEKTPHIIVMTGGEGSHRGCCNLSAEEISSERRKLTRDALKILGVPESHIHELNFPDGGISTDHPEVLKLKDLLSSLKPEAIFVPHWGEGWPDHVITAQIVKDIVPNETSIWEYCVWMWYYNVWRGLDWKNATALKMTPKEHELKLRAVDEYIKPLAPCGKPWSGVLPKLFLDANRGAIELYFQC